MVLIGKRLAMALPVLAGVLLVTFFVMRMLPGDPVAHLASAPGMTHGEREVLRRDLGLDLPIWQQFWRYLQAVFQGDLGRTLATGRPVAEELAARLPASAELTLAAFALACAIAIPGGMIAALQKGRAADFTCRMIAMLGMSLPAFVTGLLLIHAFYFRLGWAPEPIGRIDPFLVSPPDVTGFLLLDSLLAGDLAALRSAAGRLVLPALAMAIFAIGPILRITRAAMVAVLDQDFVKAARLNGVRRRRIIGTYAFRNAMLPVIATMAMTFSYMLGANVLIEKVFAWPGIGGFAVDALIQLDHNAVQGFMLVMATVFLCVNLLADLAQAAVDPRADFDG